MDATPFVEGESRFDGEPHAPLSAMAVAAPARTPNLEIIGKRV
jgi:hypothetical protein